MDIEKSIGILKVFRNYNKFYKEENKNLTITITLETKESIDKAIETLLTAYEEKEKIIDEMAGYLAIIRDCPNENCGANLDCENRCNNDDDLIEECWKMYFERKIKYE